MTIRSEFKAEFYLIYAVEFSVQSLFILYLKLISVLFFFTMQKVSQPAGNCCIKYLFYLN